MASRVVWRVLRILLGIPIVPYGSSELARALETSHASATRALRKLEQAGLCIKRKGSYRANPDQPIVRYLWLLLQAERYRNLPSDLINAIELVTAELAEQGEAIVLFGSWAHGVADESSDIDICLFGDNARSQRLRRQSRTFEIQAFPSQELEQPSRTVVLDAVCLGMPLKGADLIYDAAVNVHSFPKPFLLERLAQAQDFIVRSEDLTGPAGDYYRQLAERTLQQIDSILRQGRTVARREATSGRPLRELCEDVSTRLAGEADRVWLT